MRSPPVRGHMPATATSRGAEVIVWDLATITLAILANLPK